MDGLSIKNIQNEIRILLHVEIEFSETMTIPLGRLKVSM